MQSSARYSTLLIISVLSSYLAYSYLSNQSKEPETTAKMAELKVGDSFPSGVTFSYVPYTPENGDITSCGIPINYDASKGLSSSSSSPCQPPLPHPQVPMHASPANYPAIDLQLPQGTTAESSLTIANCRMGWQESRRLLRARRLHTRLLGQASPRLHREPLEVEEQGRGCRGLHCVQ